jgi:hypothetical protein
VRSGHASSFVESLGGPPVATLTAEPWVERRIAPFSAFLEPTESVIGADDMSRLQYRS